MKHLIRLIGMPPLALGMSLSMIVLFFAFILESAVGAYLDGLSGKVLAGFALFSVLFLVYGWLTRDHRRFTLGLLLGVATWTGVSSLLLLEGSSWVSALLAMCWAVSGGGAWLIEKRLRGEFLRSVR